MAEATYPQLEGEGLALRPWDEDLAEQMGNWGVRGFPYHAFDLLHLKDPVKRALTVESCREEGPHRHFVAVEDGVAVGRVSVNLRDPTGSYIWAVHVPPEHEGRAVCRRMLAVLMRWLEVEHPRPSFALTANAFNEHAHRAYGALGFEVAETRWNYDREIAEALWRVTPKQREPVQRLIRFQNGRWQTKVHIFRRQPGAPMDLGIRESEGAAT
ncbi:MAG: GNAT family N-acetyltransferase [Dehalococcoidia bacterium]|uniref:GNAT family N-acetyltransferase n=1 Tax=Candidatus Amarobacter glycogenicus TaxID=3140699 RepID=UPI003136A864|nr:GNAT family N-acetyltransferase [Dehalococcoidia bacterium]MBK6563507.1 GNAT family N-acetyltransferase [Dehalococcoidia bacterium]MBK7127505.1 GNAT family N-acetyltransferase [Dehalococcoidia bacterium]MBK7330222.1 GNAT family N-acetyltransferase [Dehalococcoidia bacterium]MBK8560069.1 GNAT family N-acetyltransferase [Dehalococcoidia bacterium]